MLLNKRQALDFQMPRQKTTACSTRLWRHSKSIPADDLDRLVALQFANCDVQQFLMFGRLVFARIDHLN